MADPRFFVRRGPFSLAELAELVGAALAPGSDPKFDVRDAAALERLDAGDIGFAVESKDVARAPARPDVALILRPDAPRDKLTPQVLLTGEPQKAFAGVLAHFYPPQVQPGFGSERLDASARIGAGCQISPSAVIGPNVEIGIESVVGPNAVIAPGVRIGRWCRIGAGVSLSHALVGDRVIIHPNAGIGQDGFGYAMSGEGHVKLPQIGRVILQDDVEVGALSAIDRGALADTVIGQGTKIDNLVQIGHNCQIGRHCIIAGMCGLSGSVTTGDFVILGGAVGVADHVFIGEGARVAARSGITGTVPAGATYGGYPGRPIGQWRREVASLARMVKKRGA